MPDVSYVPGALTAVTGDQYWVLVEASPDSPPVTRIWQQLSQGVAADALLVGLLADGAVPGFALLTAAADGQSRLFCRGAVGAAIVGARAGEGEAAAQRVDGAGLLTWREHVVANAERVFLGEPPADTAPRLPATYGVLLAGSVIIDFTNVAERQAGSNEPEGASERPKKTVVPFPDPITVPPPDDPDPGNDGEYDFLWSETHVGAVEDAAIRGPGDGGPLPGLPGGLIDAPQRLAGPGGSASTVERGDAPAPAPSTVPPDTVPPDSVPPDSKKPDGAPPDSIGPVVPALVCPDGHVNPPIYSACRRCGASLPQDPVAVPRPVLGVLRLSTGDVITLDRGVIMGRSPRTDFAGPAGSGGSDGEERPHIVKLSNTGGDISRTHLRVALDGWNVLVTDLNSTNGTLVALPGRDPRQLRPGEPMPIQSGTVVTLAEGIDFRYEATD